MCFGNVSDHLATWLFPVKLYLRALVARRIFIGFHVNTSLRFLTLFSMNNALSNHTKTRNRDQLLRWSNRTVGIGKSYTTLGMCSTRSKLIDAFNLRT